jgi:hypothetical protein
MADRGLGPKPDAAFLAGYEELVFRKSCLEEELQNRQRSQSHRSEWAKLIDDSRRA